MNKFKVILLMALVMAHLSSVVKAADFTYTASGGTATITNYTGPGGAIAIPSSIDGKTVVAIGSYAFHYDNSVTSVTIPTSVTSINPNAFWNCTSMTAFVVDEANLHYSSLDGVLFNKLQTTLHTFPAGRYGSYVIPSSVTTLSSGAFNSTNLTSLTIPSSVSSIPDGVFYYTELTEIAVDAANPSFSSLDGVLFNKSKSTLIRFPEGKAGAYVIPSSVTSIQNYAFYSCSELSSLIIPSSVTSIGNNAFYFCSSLGSISIPSSVISIGDYAFYYCSNLTSITIPSSVINIGDGAFYYCPNLSQILAAESNPYFSSLDGVLFNKSKTTLIAFPGAKAGAYVIPSSVTTIQSHAFNYCSGLTNVTIPTSVTSIQSSAFQSCTGLTSVAIPSSVTSISSYAFSYCSSIASVTIPSSVTSISYNAFYYCTNLTSVTFPSSIVRIDDDAFYYCNQLTMAIFTGNAPSMGTDVFSAAASGFIIYYLNGKTGFTSPTWNGYAATMASPATITTQPASTEIDSGYTTTLSVTATGMPLTYQWYQGNSGDTTTPVGTNSASFTTPTLSSSTNYWVKVMDADSTTALVTVHPTEIVVESPADTNLVDGSATLNFGNLSVGATLVKTITIRNTGEANLFGLTVTRSGTNASDFTVGNLGSTSIAPGARTTFTVTFAPSATGTRSAALQISSNDADESPFDINLGGTGLVPYPEIAVEHPVNINLVDGVAALDFGSVDVGKYAVKTITVRNTGWVNLTGLALTLSGTNSQNFSLRNLESSTLAPGASATFTVTFSPSAGGTRSAALQISSNDADENPFNISLAGTGMVPPAPEIVVQHPPGTTLVDGNSSLTFDNVQIGATVRKTVTVRNTGKGNLTGLALSRTGTNAAEFGLADLGAATLAPGASTTLIVAFTPSAAGTRRAALQILSNDADESPFNISLSGMGVIPPAPEIVVEHPVGTNLADGNATLTFGNVETGKSFGKIVTVRNKGTASLTGLSLTHNGTNATNFFLGSLGATTLAPGASTTFTVTFKPSATGERVAALLLASNDLDERPFNIKLNGIGIKPKVPEISVMQGTDFLRMLKDNLSTCDFSTVKVGQSSKVMTFTIKNVGKAPLKQIKITKKGKNPDHFNIVQLPGTSLNPGATTQFKIVFKPNAAVSSSAVLYIANNDADENPFQVKLTGKGVQ